MQAVLNTECLVITRINNKLIWLPSLYVAQRERYSDTGKRCVKGEGVIEQFYEARTDGKTNAITTVQKDNAVCEPVIMQTARI